ncbi:MAG: inorganic diphosphatase [Candidatus Taylorbacteria bacterium]|nr:inorganic diphosphatase [Candidatus Taylorbacteria bacterium]
MKNSKSKSLEIAKQFLGKEVEIIIDRPLGSKHPKHGFVYEVNYGYIKNTLSPDGKELDAYYLGVNYPLEKAEGEAIAIIHRDDNDDDKLIVVPVGTNLTDKEILEKTLFQEQYFKSTVVRKIN